MKAPVVLFLVFILSGCIKEQVNRNLEDWEGTWSISTAKEGEEGGAVAEFLNRPWKRAEIVNEDFGTFTIDEDGNGLFEVKNHDFSDTLLPFTASFYLQYYGNWQFEWMGLKIIESMNPDFPVGKEICNDGNLVMLQRDNMGKKRVVQLDNFPECGFLMSDGIQWFILEKQ